jgi:hypothetical protein
MGYSRRQKQMSTSTGHTPLTSYWELMCSVKFFVTIRRGKDTELGWIISGKILLSAPEEVPRKDFFIRSNGNLDQHLQRFWRIDELPNNI